MDNINPSKREATKHEKNPAMAKPILCFMEPHIAGIAPTAAPLKIEPRMAPDVNASILNPPKTKSAPTEVSAPKNTNSDCRHTN